MASSTHDTTTTSVGSSTPTYMSTKESIEYARGKAAMAIGDFESALSAIGDALKSTLEALPPSENDAELHESLAPLYYLYGSTLLYSAEESTVPDTEEGEEEEEQQEDAEEAAPSSTDESAVPEDQEDETDQEEQEDAAPNVITAMTNTAKCAEDIQIAWENLESARNILETLCENFGDDADVNNTYKIDLAQVHLRLGDLQRGNGNYESAIEDYLSALRTRTEIYGLYNRSVADCHYSLGMAYILLASEDSGDVDDDNDDKEGQKKEWRRLSVLHDLACGRALGGLIGRLCGVEADEVVSKVPLDGATDGTTWWEPKSQGEAASDDDNVDVRARCSAALEGIRERVKELKISQAQDDGALVLDLIQMLDEIKETVDASDESAEAVEELSKVEADKERDAIVEVMTKAMGAL